MILLFETLQPASFFLDGMPALFPLKFFVKLKLSEERI